jgi:acetyl-CoA carboxylase biotin carboxyl carrier protein
MSPPKNKLDTGLIRELAAILRDADLGELEVEHEGLRVRVTKSPPAMVQAAAVPAPVMAAPPQAVTGAPPPGGETPAAPAIPENAVKSPMVGTAYLSADPNSKPYISVGQKVKKGDTLLLIEAMKTFNPVEADRAGTVQAIYVTDAQPVEYGEPLVLIS